MIHLCYQLKLKKIAIHFSSFFLFWG